MRPRQTIAHLARIGIDGAGEVSADTLERLHVAHLRSIPFENLDLHLGRPIRFDPALLFDKLVTDGRGGYCYELNGLLASTLTTLGFVVTLHSCRVATPDGGWSPAFDHLALSVELDGNRHLVDVGFGDSFLTPHPLGSTWHEGDRRFRTVAHDSGWHLERDGGDGWSPMYAIDPTPRGLTEFVARSRWHEGSPDSHFQQHVFVSRATVAGRVTISDDRLIETRDGVRTEEPLLDAVTRRRTLETRFSASIADAYERASAGR